MSIVKTVGRGMAWNGAGIFAGKLVIFFNVFLILRHLSLYEYGLSELVLSVITTLGIFQLPGLSAAVIADLASSRSKHDYAGMKIMFMQFFILTGVLSGCAWALLFFGASLAAHLAGNDAIGYLIRIASLSLLVAPLRGASTMLATVEMRFGDQSFYGVIEEAVKGMFLAVFFYGLGFGVAGLLYAIVLSQGITALLFAPRTLSAFLVFGRAYAPGAYRFWKILGDHRKWSIASSYIGSLSQTLQVWIVRLVLGTEAVALYSFAMGIYSQVCAFLPLGNTLAAVLPRYVGNVADFTRYIRSALKFQVMLAFLLILATYIGLPVLLYVFPKYAPSAPLIRVMIFALIPVAISAIYTPAFFALKKQYAFFQSMMWRIIFSAVGMWTAASFCGISGIGIGLLTGVTMSTVERTWRLQRELPELAFSVKKMFSLDPHELEYVKVLLRNWKLLRHLSVILPKKDI